MRVPSLLLAVAATGCAISAPPATHTEYQYALAPIPNVIAAGDTVQLTWNGMPRQIAGARPPEALARVCVALIGPFTDVARAKASSADPRACPIDVAGTIATTEVTEIDLLAGTPAAQRLVLPATVAPGFYNVWNVLAYGRTDNGNAATSAGLIQIVPRQP